MREYGQVQCSFWSDPDMQQLSDQSKLLALYLLTGPHSNGIGCYRLPYGYVQADFGWSDKTVSKGFGELFEAGFCSRCESTGFVLIPKFLKWNPIANPNVAKSRQREFETVPRKSSIHKDLSICMLEHGNHWSNPFETLLKRYAEQDPTQPNPDPTQKYNDEPAGADSSIDIGKSQKQKKRSAADLFSAWYVSYPNKKGRGEAWKAWQSLKPDRDMTARMIRAVRQQKRWRDAMANYTPDAFVPPWKHPGPWLRSERWDDQLDWPSTNSAASRSNCSASDYTMTGFD